MKVMDFLKELVGGSSKGKKTTSKSKTKTSKGKRIGKSRGKRAKVPKRTAKNEFRYNNQTRHPNYIFEEDGNKYHSLGITHHDTTKDKKKRTRKNMPLTNNPDNSDSQDAYIRYGVITDKKKNYSEKKITKMKFSKEDFPKVKSKIRNYKKEREKRKKTDG